MATLIGLLCYYERKNWRGRRQKSQVGKGRANKEGREWAGDRGELED